MAATRRKGRDKRQTRHETPEVMRERVLGAFGRWLVQHPVDGYDHHDVFDVVHTACEFKSSVLGEPNPADWSQSSLGTVIGEVFPAKTVGVEEQYARTIVPAMLGYIDFLVATGRWKPVNDVKRSRLTLLSLTEDLPGRFGDPTRMSMASRLFGLALDEGVDPSDPAALSDFMDRFNNMPYEWRKRLTDGPDLLEGPEVGPPSAPAEPPNPFEEACRRAITLGLSGLHLPLRAPVQVTVPSAAEEAVALGEMEFVRRMRAMVEWVGAGRPVTQTGAMRRVDTVEWMRRYGLRVTDETKPASMWDIRDIGQPWAIAIETGMLALTSTKIRPGPAAATFDSEDWIAQVNLGRSIVNVFLQHSLSRTPFIDELQPAIMTVMLPLLAVLCRPTGQDIGYLRDIREHQFDTPAHDDPDRIARNVCASILTEIRALDHWGLVTEFDRTPLVPAGLRPAVVAAIHGPGAPLSVEYTEFAVPLDIDD